MRHAAPYEFNALATYNAERARGIVHTPEWVEAMRLEQERFTARRVAEAERNGWTIVTFARADA